jgi:hypothetical protein
MKTKNLVIAALLMLSVALFSSGCQTLGSQVVNVMYGRSGVFVTNNYAGYRLHVICSNGQEVDMNTGDTMQFLTAGFINGDNMWLKAKFYTLSGRYAGYDERTFGVYYYRGGASPQSWAPQLNPVQE